MKVKREVEVAVCDFCQENDAAYLKCLGCGKDICYDCKKTEAVEYSHSVYFSGSGDGLYCHDCDGKMKTDPLHRAYARIAALRREATALGDDLKKRSDAAEAALKEVQADTALVSA